MEGMIQQRLSTPEASWETKERSQLWRDVFLAELKRGAGFEDCVSTADFAVKEWNEKFSLEIHMKDCTFALSKKEETPCA